MIVLSSFLSGFRIVLKNKFLVGGMFLFKFLSSLLLFFPLYLMLSSSFARNVKTANFLKGIDLSLIIDFVYHWRNILPIYLVVFFVGCVVFIVVFVFLWGGFWGTLRDDIIGRCTNSRIEKFFGYSGKCFTGMLKVALLLTAFYFLALLVFLFLGSIISAIGGKFNAWEIFSGQVLGMGAIAVFLFSLVNMTGDYLKIHVVVCSEEKFSMIVKNTFRFLLTNFFRCLSLYYLLSLVLLGLILAFWGWDKIMSRLPDAGIFIFLTFLFQQFFVLFHSFHRLVYYSAQLTFYHQRCPEERTVT
jgi:hypothetical protein